MKLSYLVTTLLLLSSTAFAGTTPYDVARQKLAQERAAENPASVIASTRDIYNGGDCRQIVNHAISLQRIAMKTELSKAIREAAWTEHSIIADYALECAMKGQ